MIIDSTNIVNGNLPFIVDVDQDDCPDIVMSDNYMDEGFLVLYHQNCGSCVEEADLKFGLSCKVFPVPSICRVKFTLFIPYDGRCRLRIYDIGGGLVYELLKSLSQGKQMISCNITEFLMGTYFYKINLGNQSTCGKFTLIK